MDNEPVTAPRSYSDANIALRPLHVVVTALPQVSGYALRTQYLAEGQRQLGVEASVLVHPASGPIPACNYITSQGVAVRCVNGVMYYRYTEPNRTKRIFFAVFDELRRHGLPSATRFGTKMNIPANAWEHFFEQVAASVGDVAVVHAHTPPLVGERGFALAKRLGVPFVYEVRGFWDLSAESDGRNLVEGDSFDSYRQRELHVAQSADQVITLSQTMAEELQRRGLSHSRVQIIGNGIDVGEGEGNLTESDTLRSALQLQGKFIVGCFGNIRRLEGVDLLIRAIRQLLDRDIDIGGLIVGDGEHVPQLKELAWELRLGSRICFRGQVSPDAVPRHLSLIDAFVIPRLDLPVCRIVSPLKPMQAMAYGKPLVVSDVPALREIVGEEERGLSFCAGSADQLALCLARLYQEPHMRQRLGLAAQQWAIKRSWLRWARQTVEVYQDAMQHHREHAAA